MLKVGFNNGMGFMDVIFNKGKASAGLETSPIFRKVYDDYLGNMCYRFPGGTHANFYNRYNAGAGYGQILFTNVKIDDAAYLNINKSLRDTIYKDYYGYNADNNSSRSNIIYPFINTITNNRKSSSESTYVINVVNHYRNYNGFNTKKELTTLYQKLDNIKTYDDIKKNGFSANFLLCIDQNLSGIITLIKNGVKVDKIELGNENPSYMADGDDKQFVNNNFDTILWNRSSNNTQKFSLDIHAKLLSMYVRIIKEFYIKNNIEYVPIFGVSITYLYKNSGFKQWNDYWINKSVAEYVGFTAYIIHPYTSVSKDASIIDNDSSKLKSDFDILNKKIEEEHFQKWVKTDFKEQIKLLPNGYEIWLTEWNFGWLIPKIGNTLLGSICYFEEILGFIESPQITLCHYHSILNAIDTDYVFTRFPAWNNTIYTDPITTDNSTTNGVRYSSSYFAHLLISPILKEEMSLTLSNIEPFYFYKIFSNEKGKYIFFSNKSGIEKSITIDKKGIMNCVSGDNLYDSFGKTRFKTSENITINRSFNKEVNGIVTIPKYSIGHIFISN